jgi:hypothetical protein
MELKINISLSVQDIIALHAMLSMGKMFTRPKERERVENILRSLSYKLRKRGVPEDALQRLRKLYG